MSYQAGAKVIINGETVIDLTQDTVNVNKLLDGEIAHDSQGRQIIGAMSPTTMSISDGVATKISGTDDDYVISFT